MKRRNLDLNLLGAFDALMEEMNVSRAAEKMFMTQSAMSHTLNRLRQLFDDPLLVRTSNGMKPTSRALTLIGPVRKALQDVDRLVSSPPTFDPKASHRRFVIAGTDYTEFLIIPALIRRIKCVTPGVTIHVEHLSVASLERSLENGDVDIALGFDSILKTPNYLCSQRLFDETMACVVRKDHPEIGEEMSLEQYVHMDHVSVSMSPKQGGIVDDWLAERGLQRRVTLKIPHFLVAPFIVAQTDMVLSVPRRLAKQFAHLAPLKILAPPMKLPINQVIMVWHPQDDKEPACAWLREQVQIVNEAAIES